MEIVKKDRKCGGPDWKGKGKEKGNNPPKKKGISRKTGGGAARSPRETLKDRPLIKNVQPENEMLMKKEGPVCDTKS